MAMAGLALGVAAGQVCETVYSVRGAYRPQLFWSTAVSVVLGGAGALIGMTTFTTTQEDGIARGHVVGSALGYVIMLSLMKRFGKPM
jgi:hypothetical protein